MRNKLKINHIKKIRSLIFTTFSILFTMLLTVKSVFADEFTDLIGKVDMPKGVDKISTEAGTSNIGILLFFSKIIQIITVVAGIWVVGNAIFAAYTYLAGSGKADNHQKVNNILTSSLIGLLIIVSSYTIAGLIGLIFFGNALFIINPTISNL